MGIKSRRSGRSSRAGGVAAAATSAAFAAGVAATLVLFWLLNNGAALVRLPSSRGGDAAEHPSDTAIQVTGWKQVAEARGSQQQQHAMLPPPPPPPAAVAAPLPDLDSVPRLFLSFGNAAYFELAHNWAKSVQAIGAPYIIAAFDNEMTDLCAAVGLVCTKIDFGQAANFRADFEAFRAMGAVKVRFALRILEEHLSLPLVVVSDTDTVWLRTPWDYLGARPGVDLFLSTDCLSHEIEERWHPDHGQPRCGHIPGKNDGRAFNTGLFAVRNTPASRAALKAWADMLGDASNKHHDGMSQWGIDDQLAMNLLLGPLGPFQAVSPDDPRTILAINGTLRVQALPVVLFSNGHVAFVQRIPWKEGVAPIVIHATFQRFTTGGKKSRLREFQLWHMDPPEYYGAPHSSSGSGGSSLGASSSSGSSLGSSSSGGVAGQRSAEAQGPSLRLLAYTNGVLGFVAEAERARYGNQGRRMPLLEKHWLGMSYQLAALRDVLAAARILDRATLLPQLWCWCDYDEHTDILKKCRIKGTDYTVPFECPLDFLLNPAFLEPFGYRHAGFLQHPQVPATLRHSRAVVHIADSMPDPPFPVPKTTVGHAAVVWPGIRSGDLARAVQPVESTAVLELRGLVPGFLGGWDPGHAASAERFDAGFGDVVAESKWCCMTWGDQDEEFRQLAYALPPPLAGPWQPWKAAQLARPDWCDRVSTHGGNNLFTHHPQHPCEFMANQTAADLAADDSGRHNTEYIVWEEAKAEAAEGRR